MTQFVQPISGILATITNPVGMNRDASPTTQVTGQVTAPAAGATIATITPGFTANLEIWIGIAVTGVTVAAVDSHNAALFKNVAAQLSPLPFVVPGTVGMTDTTWIPPIIYNTVGTDTINVKALANATALSVYTVCIIVRHI
jgi:hypothetical protein